MTLVAYSHGYDGSSRSRASLIPDATVRFTRVAAAVSQRTHRLMAAPPLGFSSGVAAMARPLEFKTPAQSQARLRQTGLCAHCGDSLDDTEEHAHHVVPNQSGNPRDPNHAWLASSENCVVLCHMCHERVHQDGRYRTGAVAPPSYFMHSHGNNASAHQVWVTRLTQKAKIVWPRASR